MKKRIFLLISIVFNIAFVIYGVFVTYMCSCQTDEYRSLQDDYASLKASFHVKKSELDEANDTVEIILEENTEMSEILENYVVFVGTDEYYYHLWNCPDLDMSEFWAFNPEAAISKGYKPCKNCIL